MKLNTIYKSILRFCGLDADEQGYISTVFNDKDKPKPAFIDGLRMVLPTDHHLRNFDAKEKIIFHPLTENILRGESEVVMKLKNVINVRLNFTIGIVAQSLLNLVASPEQHSHLSPEQADLLVSIKDCDEKAVTTFISHMVAGMRAHPERLFTNIYLKRGGTYRDKRYSRVGIVTFPFYDLLKQDKVDKLRIKDKDTLKQLFQFIFPNIDDEEEYNFASDSHVAPYLEALLRTAANIASRLNDIILTYKDYIEEAEMLTFDADWLEHFQDLNALIPEIRKVPVQQGNDGTVSVTAQEEAPVQQAAFTQQQMVQGYPQQQMQQVAPKPEVKQTKRGLDFKSMAQANPAMAMTMNPLMPHLMQQQMQQQQMQMQRPPSWAQPPMQQMQQPGMMPFPQAQGFPQGVMMTPQGPMVQTPQGMMPFNQPMMQQQPMYNQQPMMMQQPGMQPTPSWAQPPMQQGYYR